MTVFRRSFSEILEKYSHPVRTPCQHDLLLASTPVAPCIKHLTRVKTVRSQSIFLSDPFICSNDYLPWFYFLPSRRFGSTEFRLSMRKMKLDVASHTFWGTYLICL